MDLGSGAVVFVGDGKSADALEPFWRRLGPSGARIEAVAIDMSQAYILAVHENLPEAVGNQHAKEAHIGMQKGPTGIEEFPEPGGGGTERRP